MWVSAYNSSPILETLSANFPTIAFWDFNHWELRDAAIPYYEDLVRVGIVHKTPASAAKKVNEVYQDPMLWWLSPEVQEVKKSFAISLHVQARHGCLIGKMNFFVLRKNNNFLITISILTKVVFLSNWI